MIIEEMSRDNVGSWKQDCSFGKDFIQLRRIGLPSNHLQQDYEDTRKDIWLENNFGANAHRNLLNLFKKVIRRSTSIL